MTRSPNKLNRFSIRVEQLDNKTMAVVEKGFSSNEQEFKKQVSDLAERKVWALNEHANILVGSIAEDQFPEDIRTNIVQGFHWACRTGPLCEQPIKGVKVELVDAEFDKNQGNRDPSEVMRGVSRAILGSFLTAKPVLLEAIYNVEVSVDWLSGPLCDAVSDQEESHPLLEALERGNLFVSSQDDKRRWFRYHHLFRDVLRIHLMAEQPDRVPSLHRRASEWYEHNGLEIEAFHMRLPPMMSSAPSA